MRHEKVHRGSEQQLQFHSWMAQQSSRPVLQVWEEVKFEPEVMCEPCEPGLTLAMAQLEDGDILCFQRALTEV